MKEVARDKRHRGRPLVQKGAQSCESQRMEMRGCRHRTASLSVCTGPSRWWARYCCPAGCGLRLPRQEAAAAGCSLRLRVPFVAAACPKLPLLSRLENLSDLRLI